MVRISKSAALVQYPPRGPDTADQVPGVDAQDLDQGTSIEAAIMNGIYGAIDRLDRLGLAIRQAPRTDEQARIQKFAKMHESDGFSVVVSELVQRSFPLAEQSLRTQLVESIPYRRYRLLWDLRHSRKLAQRRIQQPKVDSESPVRATRQKGDTALSQGPGPGGVQRLTSSALAELVPRSQPSPQFEISATSEPTFWTWAPM